MNQASDRFFNNPAFCEYIFLLAELHRLIREGRDETPHGLAINDAMDRPGEQLNSEEVAAVGVLAAEFYKLGERYAPLLGNEQTQRSPTDQSRIVAGSPAQPRLLGSTNSPRELIP